MGLLSFMGRTTFSAIFVLPSWQQIQDFGQDGGAALKALDTKFPLFLNNVNNAHNLHLALPNGIQSSFDHIRQRTCSFAFYLWLSAFRGCDPRSIISYHAFVLQCMLGV
ncbi:uncharacterized protein [Physcomitrium patens]|uniref:uncharacterized protein isoform X1 n=1 Tax=Physcomitrium patens TaxID=3218 RepID=UPI003CCD34A5